MMEPRVSTHQKISACKRCQPEAAPGPLWDTGSLPSLLRAPTQTGLVSHTEGP